jgi:glyoxylase-like metal-dependent hydrolase (beta-lactamase superfamily II)
MISVKKFSVNPFQENSYVVSDETGYCLVVDAGFFFQKEIDEVLNYLHTQNLKPVGLVNTHCHFDHLMGVDFIRNKFGIPFECHKDDAFWLPLASVQARSFGITMPEMANADHFFQADQELHFGNSFLQVIHVPGHSPGHVVFYSPEDQFLLAGDVLFYKSIGRSDLPGGDYDQLIGSIKEKLLLLPPETIVWSGHGVETSIGFEKLNNPYLI